MTRDEVKAALSSYRHSAQMVDVLERDLQEWESRYKMNLSSDCLMEMSRIMRKIQIELERAGHERDKAEAMICSLSDKRKRVLLIRKYILGQKWEYIQRAVCYSRSHVLRLHEEALEELKKKG